MGKSVPSKDVSEDTRNIAKETMKGDIRENVLEFIKHEKDLKSWKDMPEAQQRKFIDRLEHCISHSIESAVKLIASDGRKVVDGMLEKVTIKDNYQCVVNVSKTSEMRHEIAEAAGRTILLTVCSADSYMGQEAEAETDPDEPELPIADQCANIPVEADEAA